MRLLVVLATLALAGCASPDGIGFARDATLPDPYYKEIHELLAGEHHEVYELPVVEGAKSLNVTATLDTRTNGLPLPDAAPARLRVSLLAPDGSELAFAELDPQRPSANLTIEAPGPGEHLLRVDGFGASQPVEGEAYGASYALAIEVLY